MGYINYVNSESNQAPITLNDVGTTATNAKNFGDTTAGKILGKVTEGKSGLLSFLIGSLFGEKGPSGDATPEQALAIVERAQAESTSALQAQQEARSYSDWSGDVGLAGTPSPQVSAPSAPSGIGQPSVDVGASGPGGTVGTPSGVLALSTGAAGPRRSGGLVQNMYDGGVVRMAEGGDTREEALKLRQKVEQIEIPEEGIPGIPSNLNVEATSPETFERNLGFPIPQSVKNRLPKLLQTVAHGASRRLPAVQIAKQILELVPQEAVDYLKNKPAHELFGLEQSGQEYLGDLWDEVKDYLDPRNIEQEIAPSVQEGMEKTARPHKDTKVYSNVLYKGIKDKSILNFGSGSEEIVKASKGLREISEKNTVTNYDFNYNPDALEKGPYDLVMASNVLNVQPNIDTLNITINQITNSIREGGQVIFNLPSSGPLKGAYDNLTTSQAKDMLTQKFEDQGVRGTWKNEIFTGYKSERPPPPRISGTPTRAERIEMQGGPLSRRLKEEQIVRLLEGHGFNWEYNEAGGITAIESDNSKKHFRENTSLRTIRDWLGYYKGGQVRPMYDGGLV